MRNPSSLKQEFLGKWIKVLGKCKSLKKNMSFSERKKLIKLSADLAMASTRTRTTRWSRALIAEASSRGDGLAEHILGSPESPRTNGKVSISNMISTTSSSSSSVGAYCHSRRILKRHRTVRRVVKKKKMAPKVMASCIAKSLVMKRRKMLRSLLPGGEFMEDDVSLIEETLDYIQSLRAQVEVMRCLASASQLITNS